MEILHAGIVYRSAGNATHFLRNGVVYPMEAYSIICPNHECVLGLVPDQVVYMSDEDMSEIIDMALNDDIAAAEHV